MPKVAKPSQRRRQGALELSATELHQTITRAALEGLREPREPGRLNVDRGIGRYQTETPARGKGQIE